VLGRVADVLGMCRDFGAVLISNVEADNGKSQPRDITTFLG